MFGTAILLELGCQIYIERAFSRDVTSRPPYRVFSHNNNNNNNNKIIVIIIIEYLYSETFLEAHGALQQ